MLANAYVSEWDTESDVVIVGFGCAGSTAAITASDLGTAVLIVEKAPEGEHGGNTRVSGQGFLDFGSSEKAADYLRALSWPNQLPESVVCAWAKEMPLNSGWFASIGGEPYEHIRKPESIEFPELAGGESVRRYRHGEVRGALNTWGVLEDAVNNRPIEVMFSSAAQRLVKNPFSEEIIGVVVNKGGTEIRIRARRAVILACGGFEGNLDMVRTYLPGVPYCFPSGTPHNEGDGIRMAMDVGADLWHMNSFAGPSFAMKVPEFRATISMRALHFGLEHSGGMIVVGPDGRRFCNEKLKTHYGRTLQHGRWQQLSTTFPMYMVFDDAFFKDGPLHNNALFNGWTRVVDRYEWSHDNRQELERGWIHRAPSLRELATLLRLDPESLGSAVDEWKEDCRLGSDAAFGRTLMLTPLSSGPFYAVQLSTTMFNTQGGPRKNARGEVIRPDGSPIQRLYCCGELGSIFGHLYQGGGNIAEAFGFGRICGRNAATESPSLG